MAKKQQELRNEIISKQLKQAFGEGFDVHTTWGYPISSVKLQKKDAVKDQNLIFNIDFNSDTDQYSFATRYEKEGEEKQMEWIQIDSVTINFIKDTVDGITDQLIVKIKEEEPKTEEATQPEEAVTPQAKKKTKTEVN